MSPPIAQLLAERDAYKELAQALRQVLTTADCTYAPTDSALGREIHAGQHRLAVAEARLIALGLEVV